jgi:large subunit ribosomal protein L33
MTKPGGFICRLDPNPAPVNLTGSPNTPMRDQVILECTEAAKEGKAPSRYFTTKNKKLQQERLERVKYNPNLRRRTIHKEKK